MDRLEMLQKISNALYAIFGDKDFVIELQVYINGKRHKTNKADPKKIVYSDEDLLLNMEYVQ